VGLGDLASDSSSDEAMDEMMDDGEEHQTSE
jgi:hypothetical protein